MRPLPQRTPLFAEGKVINLSRNLGVAEGEITNDAGKRYAQAVCTCLILRE